jgi:hypothetical protein
MNGATGADSRGTTWSICAPARTSDIDQEVSVPSGYQAAEDFMPSETGSLLLDSQVPSSPQLCPWNLFLVQNGRLDRIRVRS